MKSILIIGATGNVGSKVVRSLFKRKKNIKAAVRNFKKAEELGLDDADLVEFDYLKPETFKNAFNDVDKVLFIAPPLDSNAFNLLKPAIDFAIKEKLKQIVVLSALGVDASDEIPLRKIELYVKSSGIPYTFVRPNSYMQNFTIGFLSQGVFDEGVIRLPAGNGKTSFIDARDIAEVIATILTEKGYANEEYNLTGPEALDHHEIASKLSDSLDKEVIYQDIPEEDLRETLETQGVPKDKIEFMLGLYRPVRGGFTGALTNDVERIIGRKPFFFDQFISDFVERTMPAISNS